MICSEYKLRALEIGGPVLKVEKSFQLANKNSFLRILPRWMLLTIAIFAARLQSLLRDFNIYLLDFNFTCVISNLGFYLSKNRMREPRLFCSVRLSDAT